MLEKRLAFALLAILTAIPLATPLGAQGIPFSQRPFDEVSLRPRGQPVIPVFDGWFENSDGTFTLCFAYFNLNTEEALDVPLGPRNRLEPADFDGVQPTHFDPVPDPELTQKYRHHWCVFAVTVPADFGDRDVIWTLDTRGEALSVPGGLIPEYVLEEISSTGRNAEAPYVRLTEGGARTRGRTGVWSEPYRVAVGRPLPLTLWIEHPNPGTWLGWTKHQGPGNVTFETSETRLDRAASPATTTVTFDTPGEYVIRVQAINDPEFANNPTGGFEFHCCWTNVYLRVTVDG